MTPSVHSSLRYRLAHLHAGTRLAIAIMASAATALLLPPSARSDIRAVASWDPFAIVALVLLRGSTTMGGSDRNEAVVLSLSAVVLA